MKPTYHPTRPIRDLRELIDETCLRFPSRPAFHVRKPNGYEPILYGTLREDINALGTALNARGLLGKRVALIGENGYEWALSYLTVLLGGGVILPLDRSLPAEEIAHICEIAEVSAILYAPSLASRMDTLPSSLAARKISFDAFPALIAEGKELLLRGEEAYLTAPIDPHAMSVLLFTSGTTGASKGVMLSQHNLCFDIVQCSKLIYVDENDVLLSVLPLHHTYECTVGFLLPLYHGASIAYAERLSTIAKNLKEVRATAMICVPLLLEAFYKKILQAAEKSGRAKTLSRAMALNRAARGVGWNLSRSLFSELHKSFGGRLRLLVSGGAAIKPEVLSGLRALGLDAIQGYGLTECAPIAAVNPIKGCRDASAGIALPGGELSILDPDENGVGEICYRGENVMLGYFQNPEETAQVMLGDRFRTGDLGYIDEDGYLYITGRKKNVIVTYNGKNIFPEEIELHLDRSPLIAESMVVGEEGADGDTIVKAYLYPSEEAFAALGEASANPDALRKLLEDEVTRINLSLAPYKRIRRIVIRQSEFVKTTTRKIRRFDPENNAE